MSKITSTQSNMQLQTAVKDTNERLNSLQSLAGEVAMAYGLNRFQHTPFAIADVTEHYAWFQRSLEQFSFLEKNASLVTVSMADRA